MKLGFRSMIISILALWRDLSWKQIAAAVGVTADRLSKMLRRREMADKDFERLLSHVQRRPAEALVVARCLEDLEALDREKELTDEEQEEVERGVLESSRHLRAELVQRVLHSRGVPAFDKYPEPSEVEPARWMADAAWRILEGMKEDLRPVVVKAVREFQTWALVERLCDESEIQASRDLKRAASLAQLAVEIAELVRGPEGWCLRVRGYAAAHGANITRVKGELPAARVGMDCAIQLWEAGSDPNGMLDPGRLLDLEASLLRDERRFEDALDRLTRALSVSHRPGHILIKKGFTLEVMGEYERGIETLLQAKLLVERQGGARLENILNHNLAVLLSHVCQYEEAARLGREVRELAGWMGDELGAVRGVWLEGRIAAGLGLSAKAETLLEQAAQEFSARKMWYDVALARLEMAPLLLVQGRHDEVRTLSLSLGKIFEVQGVHREALAALQLFREAVARGEATAELARRVLRFLFRARYDLGLRFSASGAGAAVGVPAATSIDGVHSTAILGNGLTGLAAPTTGVPAAPPIYARTAPENRELPPELIKKGQMAGRSQERRGEGEGDKSWTHDRISRATPDPDLLGPLGPRLPGMLLQERGKNSPPFLVTVRLRLKTLLVRLFRALTGQTQKEFGEALDIDPAIVAQCELGKHDPGLGLLERMAQQAALTVREGEEALHFIETLRRPRRRAGLGWGDLTGDLAAVAARVYRRLIRLPAEKRLPRAEDRHSIEELWRRLKDLTEEQQIAVVRIGPEFQNWALAEKLCDDSEIQASRDIEHAASLARLAREVAEHVPGPETWRKRIQGYAVAAGSNVMRVAGELKMARTDLEAAKQLWQAGSDPEGLLDPGRLLDLEASLCRDERQFDPALTLLDEAFTVGRQKGRILIKKGFTLEVMGRYEQALETTLRAKPLVEAQGKERLLNILHLNLAVQYCHVNRHAEAVELVEQVRRIAGEMGDEIGVLRCLWLDGRIAAGLGRNAMAVRLLDQARQAFAERNMWYDVALADLEMAPLLLAEGAVAQVKQMAAELVVKFEQQGVHREALAALQLFQEATEREQATAELARRVLEFLFRARWDEGLQFVAE